MHSFTQFIAVFLVTTTALNFVQGGFEGFLCPGPKCEVDCKANHNAIRGFCGNATDGDFNCYCSLTRPGKSRMPKEIKKHHFSCKNEMDGRYDLVCRLDCQCNHAALDGKCNYKINACECLVGNPKPRKIAPCPFNSSLAGNQFINNLKIPNFPVFIGGSADTE